MLVNWKKKYTFLNLNTLMQNFNVDFVPIKRLKGIFKTRAMILKKNIFQIRFRLYRKKFIQNFNDYFFNLVRIRIKFHKRNKYYLTYRNFSFK